MNPAAIHHFVERNAAALIFGILFVSMLGGLAQILPVLNDDQLSCALRHVKPYSAVELAGREIYRRESCALCHTQQVRPLVAEVVRYGNYSQAGEFVYDRPFLWGSKRTGPDLHRLAGKYSDLWHRVHLRDPRAVVPDSIMPAYPWLDTRKVDIQSLQSLMVALRIVGINYSDEEVIAAGKNLQNTSEMDALIAYLQSLGKNPPPMADGHKAASNKDAHQCADGEQQV